MIPISYLFEQEEQAPQEQEPQNIADRIYTRAMMRIEDPQQTEEEEIEAEVQQRMDQEKRGAKVSARQAEERNRDTELKQLKAAEAALNQQASEDTKSMQTGVVPPRAFKDKAEKEAAEAEAAQAPPEGNSQGQVKESLDSYL